MNSKVKTALETRLETLKLLFPSAWQEKLDLEIATRGGNTGVWIAEEECVPIEVKKMAGDTVLIFYVGEGDSPSRPSTLSVEDALIAAHNAHRKEEKNGPQS